jgi:predicted nucleic acid-binding protein
MAFVYFDSSALVKLVVEEDGSDIVSALWDACDAALSSRLAYPEVCAALAAAHRNHDLDDDGFTVATRDWEDFWGATRPVELTAEVERRAGALAERQALRGADAVHLASAVAVDSPGLVIAVWDVRLHRGAIAQGLTVSPPTLPT